MADMMLTGRVYDAREGAAVGLSQYRVEAGQGLATAFALADKVAANTPLSNFAVMLALPRIADRGQTEGLLTESLMAAIAQGDPPRKSACGPSSRQRPPRSRNRDRTPLPRAAAGLATGRALHATR